MGRTPVVGEATVWLCQWFISHVLFGLFVIPRRAHTKKHLPLLTAGLGLLALRPLNAAGHRHHRHRAVRYSAAAWTAARAQGSNARRARRARWGRLEALRVILGPSRFRRALSHI